MNVYVIHPPEPSDPVLVFRDHGDAYIYAETRWGNGGAWNVEEAPLIGHGEAQQMARSEARL